MAGAKQYSDLEQVTQINAEDNLAFSQAGAQELKTGSVSALAAKVGELNTEGALSELVLATSMGKNQLSSALTEKGASSTPSDTLVQMADKVRNLITTEQWNSYIAKVITYYEQDTSASDPDGYSFQHVDGHALLVFSRLNQKIYYCQPKYYPNIASAVADAYSSVECTVDSTIYPFMGISTNEQYIAIHTGANTVSIYTVDHEAHTLTLHSTITTVATPYNADTPQYQSFVTVDDNAQYIAFANNNQKTTIKRLSDGAELSTSSSVFTDTLSFDSANNTVYVYGSNYWNGKLTYDFDNSTLSETQVSTFSVYDFVVPALGYTVFRASVEYADGQAGADVSQYNRVYTLSLSAYTFDRATLLDKITLCKFAGPQFLNSSSSAGYLFPLGTANAAVSKNSDGTYNLNILPLYGISATFNAESKKFTVPAATPRIITCGSSSPYMGLVMPLFWEQGQSSVTMYALADYSWGYSYGSFYNSTNYPYKITLSDKEYFCGYVRGGIEAPGKYEYLFTLSAINGDNFLAILENGVMDVETNTVLVPSEEAA